MHEKVLPVLSFDKYDTENQKYHFYTNFYWIQK